MIIEIIIPIYQNYELAYRQIRQYTLKLRGEWRLLFCDNTPGPKRQVIDLDDHPSMAAKCGLEVNVYNQIRKAIKWVVYDEIDGIDGERHGSVLNYMVRNHTTTDLIGIQDSDFFWLDPDILAKAEQFFKMGYTCVGAELFYDDFGYCNDMYEHRAGWKAPCVFGMFIQRAFVLDKTFISTRYEGYTLRKETGWRVRKALIDDPDARVLIFPAVKLPEQAKTSCATSWYFLSLDYPTVFVGYHLIQGSGRNVAAFDTMCNEMNEFYQHYKPGTYTITDHHYVNRL